MLRRCYPLGKNKAFNLTYDDGALQDERLVSLLNRYGIKGTFNLNSQLMEQEFEWVHENGMVVKRLPTRAVGLYQGHEIASHTLTHPYMYALSREEIMHQLTRDKKNLEAMTGEVVAGFAVPFDYYSDLIAECVKECGFEYGRMSEASDSYVPWQDPYHWRTGLFHLSAELDDFVEGFFKTEQELALCQIVGHSYDLDAWNLWEKLESILSKIAGDADILPMTHIELVRYLSAMEKAVLTGDTLQNQSSMDLWFRVDGKPCLLHPGETIGLHGGQ